MNSFRLALAIVALLLGISVEGTGVQASVAAAAIIHMFAFDLLLSAMIMM
jgi:hypothetical protein